MTLVVDRCYFTGDLWARKLINLLWRFTRSTWDARNVDRHGHTPLQNQAIWRNRLQALVHAIYDSSPLMLAADRDIFSLPAEERLTTHHPAQIELWISRAKPIVAISIREASTAIKHTFQSIASFFTRTPHRTLEDTPNSDKPPSACKHHIVPIRSMPLSMAPTAQVDPSHGRVGEGKQQRLN
jgi:hypothetical protein